MAELMIALLVGLTLFAAAALTWALTQDQRRQKASQRKRFRKRQRRRAIQEWEMLEGPDTSPQAD